MLLSPGTFRNIACAAETLSKSLIIIPHRPGKAVTRLKSLTLSATPSRSQPCPNPRWSRSIRMKCWRCARSLRPKHAFTHALGNWLALVRLTPEPKRIVEKHDGLVRCFFRGQRGHRDSDHVGCIQSCVQRPHQACAPDAGTKARRHWNPFAERKAQSRHRKLLPVCERSVRVGQMMFRELTAEENGSLKIAICDLRTRPWPASEYRPVKAGLLVTFRILM